jgi:hypothetical protein
LHEITAGKKKFWKTENILKFRSHLTRRFL